MKIMNGLARIFEYKSIAIYAYIIRNNGDYVYYRPIFLGNNYQGYALDSLKNIHRIIYNSKHIDFYKIVMEDEASIYSEYVFNHPKQLIVFCYEHQKCIEITKKGWGSDVEDILIEEINDTSFSGRRINKNGELKEVMVVSFADVEYVLFDSIMLRNFEKILFK